MIVLVTGSKGQLGSEIKELQYSYNSIKFIFKDLPEFDISNYQNVKKFVIENEITTIINCAAYTNVDKAEEEFELARKVNSDGILNLVKVMELVDGKIIHISTDYVFNGTSFKPYEEGFKVDPISVYGKTKREGELAVINSNIEGIVIRTSWLYSAYGNNFVKSMMNLGNENQELNVIFDQIGSPTYAGDLASVCLEILSKGRDQINKKGEIYHFSNEGVASWYDFAIAIMEISKINCKVLPILTKDFPIKTKRPHFSVLNKTKIKNDFNIQIPYWRDSLKKCINKLQNI